MKRSAVFTRSFEAGDHAEVFLVSAVSAILGIRLFLHLTGYPQIGGASLHVAHVLWGGLLMLAAILLLLVFLGAASRSLAAIVGGVGFGAFVDEIGKFVTRDYDYFYQPAVALIYALLVLVFLAVRGLHWGRAYTDLEYLLNALRETEEMALHDLDPQEKERALEYLAQSDPRHPLVPVLRRALEAAEPVAVGPPSPLTRARERARTLYGRLTRLPGFERAVVALFVGQLLVKLGLGARLVLLGGVTPLDGARLAASALSAALVLLGVVRIRRSRLDAYRMFERAILVSILLVQPLSFYLQQFAALVELAFNVTILALLRTVIRAERSPTA